MLRVRNFEYNGFGGRLHEGYASYEVVNLIRWTLDPGVGLFMCGDGQERALPTFVIEGPHKFSWVQPNDAPENYSPVLYIGAPSRA